MRKQTIIIGLLLLLGASSARAQSNLDLGGVGQFLANVALTARGGTGVDLNKHVTGVLYLPYPALHSADGKTEYAVLGLGADLGAGASGTAMHGSPLILPMFSVTGLTSLITGSSWAQQHLTFPALNVNIELGVGVKPLPIAGTAGKWILGNQIEGVATIGLPFGSSSARTSARQILSQ